MDCLEFVDVACSKLLAELCLAVTGFTSTFSCSVLRQLGAGEAAQLQEWLVTLTGRLEAAVRERLTAEPAQPGETGGSLLLRAVDRLYRRLAANNRLVQPLPPPSDLAARGLGVVTAVAASVASQSLQ